MESQEKEPLNKLEWMNQALMILHIGYMRFRMKVPKDCPTRYHSQTFSGEWGIGELIFDYEMGDFTEIRIGEMRIKL
jgi:hypothetical protein